MKLVIAEKPSLGKAIQAWLVNEAKTKPQYKDYKVTWLYGHMLEMVNPEVYDAKWKSWDITLLPIKPQEFKLSISNNSGVKAQVAKVKALYKECSEIIHAGDPDREGQLLVDELLESFNNKKPVYRLWLAAIDDQSIAKAFKNIKPNTEYLGYKLAAEARSRADWLVGMNYSRAFSYVFKSHGYQTPISIGRVQTPTLKLITDRDNEIKHFISKDFYELFGIFSTGADTFKSKLVLPDYLKLKCDEEGRVLDKELLTDIANTIKNKPATVSKYSKDTKATKQPLLFNLSELQATANKKYGYSAQQVLDIAQTLYENKLTTYPRSDCRYLPESQFSDAANIIKNILKTAKFNEYNPDVSIKSSVWNDKKITAHHAIIPTGANLNELNNLKESEQKIFDLIAFQYLLQFYPPLEYDQVEVTINLDYLTFFTAQKSHVKLLQNVVETKVYNDVCDEIDEDNLLLPKFYYGQKINCTQAEIIAKKTQMPKPYTEGTLIKAMENIHTKIEELVKQQNLDNSATLRLISEYKSSLKETSGLGTEATRASIIEILKKRGFIASNKKAIIATDMGHLLINVMTNNKVVRDEFEFLTNAITTAKYEQYFDEIQNNKSNPQNFLAQLYKQLDKLSNFAALPFEVAANTRDGSLSIKNAKAKTIAPKLTSDKCPKCGKGDMLLRVGQYSAFKACNKYPQCKYIEKVP